MSEVTVTVQNAPVVVTVQSDGTATVVAPSTPSTVLVQGVGLQGPSGQATGDIDLGTFN